MILFQNMIVTKYTMQFLLPNFIFKTKLKHIHRIGIRNT